METASEKPSSASPRSRAARGGAVVAAPPPMPHANARQYKPHAESDGTSFGAGGGGTSRAASSSFGFGPPRAASSSFGFGFGFGFVSVFRAPDSAAATRAAYASHSFAADARFAIVAAFPSRPADANASTSNARRIALTTVCLVSFGATPSMRRARTSSGDHGATTGFAGFAGFAVAFSNPRSRPLLTPPPPRLTSPPSPRTAGVNAANSPGAVATSAGRPSTRTS